MANDRFIYSSSTLNGFVSTLRLPKRETFHFPAEKQKSFAVAGAGQARVADFGLAHRADDASGRAAGGELVETEMLTGTFGYTAPEYLRSGVLCL